MAIKISDYTGTVSALEAGDLIDVSKRISTGPDVYESHKADASLLANWNLFGQDQTLQDNRTHDLNDKDFGLLNGDIGFGDSVTILTQDSNVSRSFAVISSNGTPLFHVSNVDENLGIGTNAPATSAVLELNANDKGFLKPRLTTTERDNITLPVEGLEIYNTTTGQSEFYNGSSWSSMGGDTIFTGGTFTGDSTVDLDGNEVNFEGGVFNIQGAGTSTGTTLALYDNDTTPNKTWEWLDNGDVNSTLLSLVSTTGEISIGSNALGFGTGISIGKNAGSSQTGAAINNTFIGKDSGLSCTTGLSNTGLGKDSLRLLTTGSDNIGIGRDALSGGSITGNFNVGVGYLALEDLTSSSENVGFGGYAGRNIATGSQNTCIGSFAGSTGLVSGSRNVFLGYSAGRRETGSDKFMVDNRVRSDEATSRVNSIIYGEMASSISSQRLTINGKTRLQPMSAADAAVLTALDGDMVYVNTTDATFTAVGFWGYENGAWVKL